jgi:indole-3-glycerol phosphate synthase
MTTFLERILTSRRGALDQISSLPERELSPVRDFRGALAAPGMSLIAEIKRASPSRGDLNPALDPAQLAAAYERGGARAVSVLVEPEFFKGSEDDVAPARNAVSVPVLWKDFVISPAQVMRARYVGADAILVIVRIIDDATLAMVIGLARELELCPLVEVFDERDLERALEAGADVIGVNHRDLETFEEDPTATKRLRPLVPDGVIVVGESAISSRADVADLEAIGVDAVLVGEVLVRSEDPAAKIEELLGA